MLTEYDTENRKGWYYRRHGNDVISITFNAVYDKDVKLWRITIKSAEKFLTSDWQLHEVSVGDSIWCQDGQFWIQRASEKGTIISTARDKTGDKTQAYSIVDGNLCCYAVQIPW